jgi:hypothetical protein
MNAAVESFQINTIQLWIERPEQRPIEINCELLSTRIATVGALRGKERDHVTGVRLKAGERL